MAEIREITLDTETTGFYPDKGDRIVEIGCVELINYVPTGNTFHAYINPERDMPQEAFEVHGLSAEFLSQFPVFSEVYREFVDFMEDSPLVIHNAKFDMKFINAEFLKIGENQIPMQRAIDTLKMARMQFPGSQASLDALCRRFGIDNSSRTKHGALLDAELLADVYLELRGGRQPSFGLNQEKKSFKKAQEEKLVEKTYRQFSVSEREKEQHDEFIKQLKNPLWNQFK